MLFLVDENLPDDVAEVFRAFGHDALYVPDVGLRGVSDSEIWKYAATAGQILVTRDLDFPLSDRPAPAGLVLFRLPRVYRRAQIVAAARELAASPTFQHLEGAITVISPGRVRSRKL